jgi:hypothetical protein
MFRKKIIGIGLFLFIFIVFFVVFVFPSKKTIPSRDQGTSTTTLIENQIPLTVGLREKQKIDDIALNGAKKFLSNDELGVRELKLLENYAIETVYSKKPLTTTADGEYTGEDAYIILKKEKGNWDIVAGPVVYFDEDYLKSLNIPPEVIKEANKTP